MIYHTIDLNRPQDFLRHLDLPKGFKWREHLSRLIKVYYGTVRLARKNNALQQLPACLNIKCLYLSGMLATDDQYMRIAIRTYDSIATMAANNLAASLHEEN